MGKQNRQRRADKQRREDRQQRWRQHRHGGGPGPWSQPRNEMPPVTADVVEAALAEASIALRTGDQARARTVVDVLVTMWRAAGNAVPAAVAACLERAVRGAWSHGWQPADLPRFVRRTQAAAHAELAVDVITADAETYRLLPSADGRWMAQLDEIGARRWWAGGTVYLSQRRDREGRSEGDVVTVAAELLSLLWHLPRLPRLCPPPAEWGRAARGSTKPVPGGLDAKILGRVRALLAKAESTTFASEAEALTAKAQQLIARHAIDRAMLEADSGATGEVPVGRRLAIDDPYAGAKASLLSQVATAGRCRAVWSREMGSSTVLGFAADVDAVEILYTSLLVQATNAMVKAGSDPAQRRSRTRGFRSAFLTAFAVRVGQRLTEANQVTMVDAEEAHGPSLLPVLAFRERAVDALVEEAFPALHMSRSASYDAAGWAAGAAAAELADLAAGPRLQTAAAGG